MLVLYRQILHKYVYGNSVENLLGKYVGKMYLDIQKALVTLHSKCIFTIPIYYL